jgi:hypothetical protein
MLDAHVSAGRGFEHLSQDSQRWVSPWPPQGFLRVMLQVVTPAVRPVYQDARVKDGGLASNLFNRLRVMVPVFSRSAAVRSRPETRIDQHLVDLAGRRLMRSSFMRNRHRMHVRQAAARQARLERTAGAPTSNAYNGRWCA